MSGRGTAPAAATMDPIRGEGISAMTATTVSAARRLLTAGALAFLLAGAAAPVLTLPAAAQESDIDGDGLFDDDEALVHGTDPFNADTDGDATPDGVEVALGTDPRTAAAEGERIDTDGDGLTDFDEANIHLSDPLDYDTDQDGRNDGVEVNLGSDPRAFETLDTDGDGITDADEAYVLKTDPLTANAPDPVGPSPVSLDSDGDGLSDEDERLVWGTDPNDGDTDGDGFNDEFESSRVRLDPLNPDSDGDGNVDGCDPDPEAAGPQVGCTAQG